MDYITDVQDDFIIRDGSRVPIRVRSHKAIVDEYHRYFSLQEKTARNGV
jgi:Ni/Co efflux regulator RcnB